MPRQRWLQAPLQQPDGSLVEREVTIGTTNRIQAQVLSGLEAGEQVVAGLRDGTADDTRRRPLRGL